MDDDRWDEQVGSVAEEAQRLLESLRRTGGGPDGPTGSGTGAPRADDPGTSGPEPEGPATDDTAHADDETWVCTDPFCRSCPLCRTVAVVRGLSPQTLRRLADLATVAAGVLADLAAERTPDRGGDREQDRPPARDAGPGQRRPATTSDPIPVRPADEGTADA